jgi:hypothetical protein
MQSTGQTSTHAVSFVPTQGSAITYAIGTLLQGISIAQKTKTILTFAWKAWVYTTKPATVQASFCPQKV